MAAADAAYGSAYDASASADYAYTDYADDAAYWVKRYEELTNE
jgi:hypothetical protein